MDRKEEERLVEEGQEVVRKTALQLRRVLGQKADVDELISFGYEGLLLATRNFDESRGVPFRRWVAIRIRGAMLDGIRAGGVLPRRVYARVRALEATNQLEEVQQDDNAARPPKSQEEADRRVGVTLQDLATSMALALMSASSSHLELAEDDRESPEDAAIVAEQNARVRKAVASLAEDQAKLLNAYYFEDKTLAEAGAAVGLSKSWTCRLHARAIEALSKRLSEPK